MNDATKIEFRRAIRRDAASIWRVRTRAIEAISKSHYEERDIALWVAAPMPNALEDVVVNLDAIVAEFDRRIVGWGFLDKEASQVEAMFVDPDFQRCGVASQILAINRDLSAPFGFAHSSATTRLVR